MVSTKQVMLQDGGTLGKCASNFLFLFGSGYSLDSLFET